MDYDPVKDRLALMLKEIPWRIRWFYRALHLFFLRAWYVRRELRRQLAQLSGRNQVTMLDAGTGFGQFSWWVAKKWPGLRIDAVDVKTDYLNRARAFFRAERLSNRVTFSQDDLTQLSLTGPYDLILSVDVMEHIEKDETVFSHFARVLRPGGVVIINTPSDLGGSDTDHHSGESFIGEHVRDGYNPEELAAKLLKSGLRTTYWCYTYGKPGSVAWRLWIKWPMSLLNIHPLFVLVLPFYYLIAVWPGLLLNALDIHRSNREGTGLLMVAAKSGSDEKSSEISG